MKRIIFLSARSIAVTSLIFISFSQSPLAEVGDEITLEAIDGSVELQGQLIDFDGSTYTISTTFHDALYIDADMVRCIGGTCPASDNISEDILSYSTVTLRGIDEDFEIIGELVGHSDGRFLLNTELGEFQFDDQHFICEGEVCPDIDVYDPKFTIAATARTSEFLLPQLLEGYAVAHNLTYLEDTSHGANPVVKLQNKQTGLVMAEITLGAGHDISALDAVANGQAEIAVLETSNNKTSIKDDENLDRVYDLAVDADVIIIGSENPVRDLSVEEARQIWSGEIETWRALGGGDTPVELHLVGDTQNDKVEQHTTLQKVAAQVRPRGVIYHKTVDEMIAAVRDNPSAVGFAKRVDAKRSGVGMVASRKECGLIANPTDFDIKIANYPMTQPIRAYANSANLHPVATDILDWSQTNDAQTSIAGSGYASAQLQRMKIEDMGVALIHNAAVEPDFQGEQFSQMMRVLRRADRLSIAFRFETGSSQLDEESLEYIRDLAVRLQDNQFRGQELMLVGFADSLGSASKNTILAQSRAESVKRILEDELDALGMVDFDLSALSFGEQMPIDCNDTFSGRANNRRVEVWTRVSPAASLPIGFN